MKEFSVEDKRAPNQTRSNSLTQLGATHQRHFKVVFGRGVVQLHLLADFLPAELPPQLSLLLHILTVK